MLSTERESPRQPGQELHHLAWVSCILFDYVALELEYADDVVLALALVQALALLSMLHISRPAVHMHQPHTEVQKTSVWCNRST
jgi:hypothetical protein